MKVNLKDLAKVKELPKRKTIRLKDYDYASEGLYFITICCDNHSCLFGHIENGEMILNAFGQIAYNEWYKTSELRPNVELGEFVIMPNHIHGIIRFLGRGDNWVIENTEKNITKSQSVEKGLMGGAETGVCGGTGSGVLGGTGSGVCGGTGSGVCGGTGSGVCNTPLRSPANNIGSIVRGYKSAVTKQLNLMNIGCTVWQRNYWDNIIRNEKAYKNISEYIINNPAKWSEDRFHR